MKPIILLLGILLLNSSFTFSAKAKTTFATCNNCDLQQQSLTAATIPLLNNNDTVFVFDQGNRIVNEFRISQFEGEEIPGTNIPRLMNIANPINKSPEVKALESAYADALNLAGTGGENLYRFAEELPSDFKLQSAIDLVQNNSESVYIAQYINNYLNNQTDIIRALSYLEIQLRNVNVNVGALGNLLPTTNVFYVKFADGSLARVKISLKTIGTAIEVDIQYDGRAVLADGTLITNSHRMFQNLAQSSSKVYMPSLLYMASSLSIEVIRIGICDVPSEVSCNSDGSRCTATCN